MILALTVASADARRRGHRHHHHGPYDYVVQPDGSATMMPGMSDRDPPRSRSRAARSRARNAHGGPTGAVPPGWQLQPADPNWSGKRFVSPDGAAWFALYATPVEHEPIAAHMKAVAFADGEEITDLAGRPGGSPSRARRAIGSSTERPCSCAAARPGAISRSNFRQVPSDAWTPSLPKRRKHWTAMRARAATRSHRDSGKALTKPLAF
jgi:hypothetical protein